MSEEFLQSDHKSVANRKEVKENYENSDSQKRERDTAEWIGRPHIPPSSNKDEEDEGKEEYVGATQASTEDNSLTDKDDEGRGYNQEYDHKDTVLSDAKNTQEETSREHEGELLSWDSLERSEDNNEDDDGTRAEDNNCGGNVQGDRNTGDGNGGGDRNTGAGGGSAEWLSLLSPSALTEALSAMGKTKASLLKNREKRSWEKVRI